MQKEQMTRQKAVSSWPDLYPPKTKMAPAMSVNFKFALNEYVMVPQLNLQGVIVAAAVAFDEAVNLYLIETRGGSLQRWFCETMISPAPLRTTEPTG